jgi:DNA polymerase III delta prime subunit
MTKNAQQALKSLLQMCRPNVRFCLICNYISKIDESLQNEFICVRFNQLPKHEIYKFIRNITETEGVSITPSEIESIQTNYYSDIRSMINFIQLNSTSSEKALDTELKIVCSDNWERIHALLRLAPSGEFREVELYIHELSIQYNIDKRNILNSYFNYVIRTYPEIISPAFLSIVENVVHTTDDVPIKSVLAYFCSNLANHYQTDSRNR